MFDPIKLMNILKKANGFKQKIEHELKNIQANGSAGGEMVKVRMNGQFFIEDIIIDADIFQQGDTKFLEDLIKSSVNEASSEIKNMLIEKIKKNLENLDFFK